MILKDLLYAVRNLRRNKLLATINVLGLSMGVSVCMVILLVVHYEMSFDRFQPDRESIYRVYATLPESMGTVTRGAPTALPVAIRDHVSGVDAVTNFHHLRGVLAVPGVDGQPRDFGRDHKTIIADPDYFKVFRYYEWVAGSPASLQEPFRIAITESQARTYFGDVDASQMIGREMRYNDSLVVYVSGIIKDITKRTDLDFTNFISFSTVEKSWLRQNIQPDVWNSINSSSQLFIRLAAGTTRATVQHQLSSISQYAPPGYRESRQGAALQPLTDLHFNTTLGLFDTSRSVPEKSTLHILVVVATLLLLMASINFINLETAQAARRAKEVGVRKVLGSSKARLVTRFLMESFVLCTLAVLLSVLIILVFWKYLFEFIPQGLEFELTDPAIVIFFICFVLIVTLLSGLYPAFILSGYQPALALKNLATAKTGHSRSAFIRKSLTVFQFSFSQVLILCTLAVALQIQFMLDKDLGFTTDAVGFLVPEWTEKPENRLLLKHELSKIPGIEAISLFGEPPSASGYASTTMEFQRGDQVTEHQVYLKYGDTAYLALFGIELLAGRNLLPVDTANEYLINETFMRELGFTAPHDAVGQTVNKKFNIAGVVKDFHGRSLHSIIKPTVITHQSNGASVGVKLLAPGNRVSDLKPVLASIEKAWQRIYPDQKFQFHFIDDIIQSFYSQERRIWRIVRLATGIAVVLSCMGLFGLCSFTVIQRTKEIGIRKTMGATVNNILFLLSKDFLKPVLIAFILSTPVAYYIADSWLSGFAYRMDLTAWVFLASGLCSVLIALLTISLRTVQAAKADPAKSLKYE